MRKLLSVGALLAASTLSLWQPQPAMGEERVVIVHHHYRHHHHHRHYWNGYEYRR